MFNRTNLLIVLIALLGAGAGFFVGGWVHPDLPPERGPAAIGTGAERPSLALPDLDSRPRTLDEWDGKLVLLNFWASWCGPCREEMPLLDRIQQRHAARGLQVIGVAVDDRASVQDFLAEHPVAYPILIDEPGVGPDSSRRFGDNRGALPYSVLVGPDRRVLERRFGSFTEAGLEEWIAPHLGG